MRNIITGVGSIPIVLGRMVIRMRHKALDTFCTCTQVKLKYPPFNLRISWFLLFWCTARKIKSHSFNKPTGREATFTRTEESTADFAR